MNKFYVGFTGALIAGASMSSYAVYDVSAITTGVADAAIAVGIIGAAVVLVVLGVKVFKWIARAL